MSRLGLLLLMTIVAGCISFDNPETRLTNAAEDIRRASHAISAAFEAVEAGDSTGYLEHMVTANRLRPHHSALRRHLARAQLMTGDTLSAAETMRLVADMGMAVDLSRDAVLSGGLAHPEFEGLHDRLLSNAEPIIRSDTVVVFGTSNFQPEGLARYGQSWLLGSVHTNRIVRISPDGSTSVVTDDIWSGMGMVVVGDWLWVATTATEEGGFAADQVGRSAVAAIDLRRNQLDAMLMAPEDTLEHWFGDVTAGPDGTIYVSDSGAPGIYRIRQGGAVEEVIVGDPFTSPQGLAIDAESGLLYVADYSAGIFSVDVEAGTARLLDQPAATTLLGIDGLTVADGSLLAIQNGTAPTRVLRVSISDDGHSVQAIEVLESNHPAHSDPTLAMVEGDTLFYVANSQWPKFAPGADSTGRRGPVVLGIGL